MENFRQNVPPGYWNAVEKAGFYHQSEAGCLRFSDQDRLDFLQRQTTNDLNGLSEGKTITTLLLSPTARILDLLTLIDQGEHILALTLPEHSQNTLRYLNHRIFFMDKVQIADISLDYCQYELIGPDATSIMSTLGFDIAPGAEEVVQIDFHGNLVWAIGKAGTFGRNFLLISPIIDQPKLKQKLLTSGAVELSTESYHILRVESGLPAMGTELTEEYTPLEVGLQQAVSGSKGCYPGQEVVARQITYDKVTQHLVGLSLDSSVLRGDRLFADGKPVGTITSTANSPRFGLLALGVVKRPFHQAGAILEAQAGEQAHPVRVVVVELPFWNSNYYRI